MNRNKREFSVAVAAYRRGVLHGFFMGLTVAATVTVVALVIVALIARAKGAI